MTALNILQLRDRLQGARSAAFVGNSSSVLSWENGSLIDSHDLVVRFNRAYTKGLEERIGSRTDVLVANGQNSLKRSPPPAQVLSPRYVLVFVNAKTDLDVGPLTEWIGDVPHVITLTPDIPAGRSMTRTRTLTMGTYALYVFLRMLPLERLFLTGFTMFGMVPGGGEKYYEQELNRKTGGFHELDQESRLFSDLLGQFPGEISMSPEVEKLANLSGDFSSRHRGRTRITSNMYASLSRALLKAGFRLRRRAEESSWLYRGTNQ